MNSLISDNPIRAYLKRSLFSVGVFAVGRGVLRALPCFALFWPVAWLDAMAPLPFWQRGLAWFVVVIGAAAAAASGFWPFSMFSLRSRSRRLSERSRETATPAAVGALRSDDLRIAAEFSQRVPAGTSADLGLAFVERVTAELHRRPARWAAPVWRWRRWALADAGLAALLGVLTFVAPAAYRPGVRVLLPFLGREIERRVAVAPGDATVPWGEDAEITLTLTAPSADRPELEIRAANGWTVAEPRSEDARARSYTVKNIVEPLPYRVRWRGETGRRFTLTPSSPIQITAFTVRVRPPDYTGQSELVQDAPEIVGLPGTQVNLTATANGPLSSALIRFSDGRERAVDSVSAAALTVSFSIDKTTTYRFVLKGTDGRQAVTGEYPIKADIDAPPTIVLVSPDQDLVVGDKEKIPITYEARDDRGLAEVALLWETHSGSHREVIARPAPGAEGGLATHVWDLAQQRAQPGELIRFRLEAVDRNTITGPGRATTEWRTLEIAGFEREHAALDRALQAWRDATVEALARMNTLEAKISDEKSDPASIMPAMEQSASDLKALQNALDNIVKRMEKDPLADYGSWMEHKAMAESLSALSQGAMKEAQSALQTGNKNVAGARVQDVSAELERMSALSEDLSKAQRASDVTDASDKLKDLGDDLVRELSEGKLDQATRQRVNDLLEEAQKKIAEMARSLQQMPQELPDDFVNQQGVKDIPLGKTQDIMKKIADAMARGDGAEALRLAKEFLSSVQKMSEKLNKAHDSYMEKNSASALSKEIGEKADKLEKITDEQRALLAETQKIESERMQQRLKEQQALLAKLYERQQKVVVSVRDALQNPAWTEMMSRLLMTRTLGQMQAVGEEFHRGRVEQSPTLLPAIIAQIEPAATALAASSATATIGQTLTQSKSEEADILKELQKSSTPPGAPSGGGESGGAPMPDLMNRQNELARKTQSLKQELQTLSRKTASLGVPLTQPLSRAGAAMEGAAGNLGKGQSGTARGQQEEALSNLLQSQSAMEQAQSAMGEMESQQGGGSGGGSGPRMMVRSGGAGGNQGTRNGKVRLPTAEDYRPPKAFREDLLESLKENYPKVYEEIIRKYYKRLAD